MSINIEDFVKTKLNESANAAIKGHDVIHPDLPGLLVAVAGGVYNEDLEKMLDKYTPSSATVRGRGGSENGAAEKTVETPVLGEGEAKYQRPNGEFYIPRKWGEHVDVEVIKRARDLQQAALLYGPPGTGKTALAEAAFGRDLVTIIGTGDTETADFIGQWVTTPEGGFEWVDGPLVRAVENGWPLLIDEIGLIDPKVMALAYGLMDGRDELIITANPKRGVIKVKKGFYVIAATNPHAPGVIISEALISRFPIQAEMSTDWMLAKKLGVAKDIVQVAQNIDTKCKKGTMDWGPQMRELLAFRNVEKAFGTKWAIQNLIAGAPENDRSMVADLCGQVYGEPYVAAYI